ncbi:MAG: TetR/AcrR family transcriptional regulator [Myxococcota bacterium]
MIQPIYEGSKTVGRPSNRGVRRQEILLALERVLARSGLGSASVAAIADEAQLAPGLIHHHFRDREELFSELVSTLHDRFRHAVAQSDLKESVDAALAIQDRRGQRVARAWVGVFAEGIRSARVMTQLRKVLGTELRRLDLTFEHAGLAPSEAKQASAALLAFVLGALVFGALLPKTRIGFAAPAAKRIVDAFIREGRNTTPPPRVR